MLWNEGTRIAIWGAGYRGRKLYYQIRHIYDVVCFIDNHPQESMIDDIPIILPDSLDYKDLKVIIGVERYHDICIQCKKMGLIFGEQYVPYNMIRGSEIDLILLGQLFDQENIKNVFDKIKGNKKTVLIIGNCQTESIKRIMKSSKAFMQEFIILNIPMIHMVTEEQVNVLKKCKHIFANLNLCITQKISFNNAFSDFYSTENIKKIIGKDTKLVLIPTIFFDIYFPQTIHQEYQNEDLKQVGILSFPYGDCILNELGKKYKKDDILEITKSDRLFSENFLKWFYKYRIEQLKEREMSCDVHILDYILDNYQKRLLFYSKNHPTNEVLIELVKRLMQYLGYYDVNCEDIELPALNTWQELIYPSVKKTYDLEFSKITYLDGVFDEPCSFDEYIESYLSCVVKKRRI